jgi:hypothetical protein
MTILEQKMTYSQPYNIDGVGLSDFAVDLRGYPQVFDAGNRYRILVLQHRLSL